MGVEGGGFVDAVAEGCEEGEAVLIICVASWSAGPPAHQRSSAHSRTLALTCRRQPDQHQLELIDLVRERLHEALI